jgi:hypothetical protein
MRVRTRIRPGIYFDEHNFERSCVVLEVNAGREWIRLDALDARARERILDPPSALPIASK